MDSAMFAIPIAQGRGTTESQNSLPILAMHFAKHVEQQRVFLQRNK
jgi:hypothetical protein